MNNFVSEAEEENYRLLPTESDVEAQAIERSKYSFGIYRIAKIEDKKFWLMGAIFFIIAYVYSVMREIKDAFIIIRQLPASIHILKLLWVPPIAMISMLIVQKALVNNENRTILKYVCIGFAVYFFIYTGISFPWKFSFEPNDQPLKDWVADGKMKYKGVEAMLAVLLTFYGWTSTVHFIASEILGSLMLSFLFMSFANDICPMKQFLRFIPLLYVISNAAIIASAGTMYALQRLLTVSTYIKGRMVLSLLFLISGFLCFAITGLIIIMEKKILGRPLFIVEGERRVKKKVKISASEAIKLVMSSKLVLAICATVLFYNVSTNMAESSYKSVLRIRSDEIGTSGGEAHVMMKQFITQLIIGFAVIFLLITPFSRLVTTVGWTAVAIIPPIFAGIASFIIFSLAIYNTGTKNENVFGFINTIFSKNKFLHSIFHNEKNPLWLEESIGVIVVAFYKVFKYAAFDIAKEAISMKIDSKYRSRFKGVYDGMCGRLGKGCGAIISFTVTMVASTTDIRKASPFYLATSLLLASTWIYLSIYLGNKYKEAVRNNTTVDIDLIGQRKGAIEE
ncbi:ADP/ATP carrier protein [Spraguea lophii 42_110]|uniref:ADP,ATP carrier protein n=1 Tax=Spraguea lophii (strain 42_110) TaxID=1358809 RepID=S7XJG3_SPRLO|nr:ADP/ATP carrier protein [Spraguea lophii 42_110]